MTTTAVHSARSLAACLSIALLAACDSGSSGSTDTGEPTDSGASSGTATAGGNDGGAAAGGDAGVTAGTSGSTTGNTTSGGGTAGPPPGTEPVLDGADLSHEATLIPRNAVDPGTLVPTVSAAGRSRAAARGEPLAAVWEMVENHGSDTDVNCRDVGAQFGSCSVVNLHLKDANGELNEGGWRLYFHSVERILRVDSERFDVFFVNGDLYYLTPADGFGGIEGSGDGAPVDSIRFVNEYRQLIQSDFLPRYWLVRDGGEPQLLPNTDTNDDVLAYAVPITGTNRNGDNNEPPVVRTPAQRFAENATGASRAATVRSAAISEREVQARIVPMPEQITVGTTDVSIAGGFSFAGAALPAATIAALEARQATLGVASGTGVPLSATIDASLPENRYTLDVDAAGIRIVGQDQEALFNGAHSLLALVQIGVPSIPSVAVVDTPRFVFRGMHVDVARNFQSADSILALLDQMAAYKLNRLHLHLADDEGWRLEIPGLPELTAVGARRAFALDDDGNVTESAGLMPQLGSGAFDTNSGTGHFSREEFVALLRHANARNIVVIPEFDMPAHARAAVVAMRARAANFGTPTDTNVRIDDPDDTSRYVTVQHYDDNILNPCVPGTYNFVERVVGDVAAMYRDAGAPLEIWHMGGDEAGNVYRGPGYPEPDTSRWDLPWEGSPACVAYIAATEGVDSREDLERHFVERVSQLVADAGIPRLYLWHEIVSDVDAGSLATEAAGVTYWGITSSGRSSVQAAHGFAARGFEVVLSSPDYLYLSFVPEADPDERGKYWAARSTDTRKLFGFAPENLPQNAETTSNRDNRPWTGQGSGAYPGYAGMQGHIWSELIRTREQFEYAVYPRLLALAERAWHRAGWELDYAENTTFTQDSGRVDTNAIAADFALFGATLAGKELRKLDAAGIEYRVPVPGASTANGTLDMNVALPGLALEYTVDGQTFTPWQPGAQATPTAVRARSADGTRAGRADPIE